MGCYSVMPVETFSCILAWFFGGGIVAWLLSAMINTEDHPNIKICLQLGGTFAILIGLSFVCSTIDWFPSTVDVPC